MKDEPLIVKEKDVRADKRASLGSFLRDGSRKRKGRNENGEMEQESWLLDGDYHTK